MIYIIIKRTVFIILILGIGIFVFSLVGSTATENLDNYIYDLPFAAGAKHRVVQGYGGIFSHKNSAALDFAMPEGTPVFAAREGVVFRFKDDSNEGGPFPSYRRKANYLIIKHADGSFGCYWHLRKNGVVVKSGPVAKGELIAYSGYTGFALRPHLHFSVKRVLSYDMDSYIRTKFKTTKGIQLLENYRRYEKPAN